MAKPDDVAANKQLRDVASAALKKSYRVHLLSFDGKTKVNSTDISELDPFADDEKVAGWGGLTGYSSRFADAVREAVNASDR